MAPDLTRLSPFAKGRSSKGSIEALIKALLRRYEGSIEALLRRY